MHRLEVEKQEVNKLKVEMAKNPDVFYTKSPLRLFALYAMMKAKNIPPVSDKLHPKKHMEHDYMWRWPLALGTSLNDSQYAAVEEMLRNPKLAHKCYCGTPIPYGEGSGARCRNDITGVFCSKRCDENR